MKNDLPIKKAERIIRHYGAEAQKANELKKGTKTTVWMCGRNKDDQDGIYCCECGYFVPLFYDYYYDVSDLKNDYMYCPHCGRKAEGNNAP